MIFYFAIYCTSQRFFQDSLNAAMDICPRLNPLKGRTSDKKTEGWVPLIRQMRSSSNKLDRRNVLRLTSQSEMNAASLQSVCFPEPPTPSRSALPRGNYKDSTTAGTGNKGLGQKGSCPLSGNMSVVRPREGRRTTQAQDPRGVSTITR